MADEGGGSRIGRFLSTLAKPFKRRETPAPQMPLWTSGIQEPVLSQGITIPALYAVSNENLILRTVLNTIRQEMFRRGWFWEKKFRQKCLDCGTEYQHDVEQCTDCQGANFKQPDTEQLLYPKWLFDQDNSMEQSMLQVLGEIETDLNIVDDAFLILVKEYFVDPETSEPVFYRIKEIVRGDPIFMRIVADKRGVRGGRYKTCLLHRDQIAYPGQEDKCQVCNNELHDVHHINTAGSGKTQYYIEGEIVHLSKYHPSKLYGRPPVNTLWRQAMTLTAMDNYIYTAYQKRRTPKGIISVTTDNLESMKSFWKSVDEKMERDPHYVPRVGIESATGRGGVNWVKFMDTLEEMQYIAVRDEIRMRIASFYGVSNVFMMDTGKSGGLNNEGMQMVVTNRAVEYGQKIYSELLFPKLLLSMDVTDWKLTLRPSEEEDEVTRLRRDEMEVNIAQRMMMLGFKPQLIDENEKDIRFTYKQPPPEQPGMPPGGGGMPMGGGMMPGMMGGMPMGGGMPMRGGMPMGGGMMPGMAGGMPPGMMGGMPPGMMGGMPPTQPGGEGVGIRTPRGPAAPARGTMTSGAPVQTMQQRGPQPGPAGQASNALMNARRPRGR